MTIEARDEAQRRNERTARLQFEQTRQGVITVIGAPAKREGFRGKDGKAVEFLKHRRGSSGHRLDDPAGQGEAAITWQRVLTDQCPAEDPGRTRPSQTRLPCNEALKLDGLRFVVRKPEVSNVVCRHHADLTAALGAP